MNTLYEEQKNKPYRTCFSNIYKEQPGAGGWVNGGGGGGDKYSEVGLGG